MIWYWILYHLGYYGGSWTDFWGGFLSDLAEFAILGSLIHVYVRVACHEPKCLRPGHLLGDLHTRSCWHHHPEGRPKKGHVQRKYTEHQARMR